MFVAVLLLLPINVGVASMTATADPEEKSEQRSIEATTEKKTYKKWGGRHYYAKRPNHQQIELPQKPSVNIEKPSTEQKETVTASTIEQEVLSLTNAERSKAGLKPLQLNEQLMASAREKSLDMAEKNYFSHTSPTYGSPFDQMKKHGVTYRAAAENIAKGQRSAKEVVQAWMDSPGHRQNILTADFTHIGIGFSEDGYVWTQQFIQQ